MSATPENTQETLNQATAATNGNGNTAATAPAGTKEFNYFFKTPTLYDNEGKEIGKGKKPPSVKVFLPVPSVEEVIEKLAVEGKVRDYIMETIYDGIFLAGRGQINEFRDNEANKDKDFTATNFDLSKLTLDYVATIPKGQRGAWAPDEEDFKSFFEAYTTVMVHGVNYDPKKVKTHTDHFKNGFVKIKANKQVLEKLLELLTVFAANTKEMEEQEQVYNWLVNRAKKYLSLDEKVLLEAL